MKSSIIFNNMHKTPLTEEQSLLLLKGIFNDEKKEEIEELLSSKYREIPLYKRFLMRLGIGGK